MDNGSDTVRGLNMLATTHIMSRTYDVYPSVINRIMSDYVSEFLSGKYLLPGAVRLLLSGGLWSLNHLF